ncbi:MAG: nucleotidyl transferase AbiEii/AbiGii toxin family protein [Elusimicrobia bacterium]|nr:nucleotidyl transferase AbiEii/AbiGii toxin family protein [Elusimicrobiota bacterium]
MKSPFIEQSALVLRILPHIAAEDCFALKGGTAINFFVRNMPRLSVDIDLTYLPIEPRHETLTKIGQSLGRIKAAVCRAIPGTVVNESRYEGHVSKLFVRGLGGEVKVEPNLVIRGSVQPPVERDLCPAARERFQAAVRVRTLADADLYGGKLCAAFDRQHPRDLFDVKVLLENEGITEDIRKAFLVYLISHDRPMSEVIAPNAKDIKGEFSADFQGMTAEPVEYDSLITAREALIKQLRDALTLSEKKFLVSVKEGKPEWTLLGLDGIERMPAVQWKLRNIGKMDPARHREQLENLRKKLGL